MKPLDPGILLRQLILEKEAEQKSEGKLLKTQFHLTYESLRPANILKETFKKVLSSTGVKSGVLNTVMGLAAGFIVKRVYSGGSHNPLKNLTGMILEMVVASKVTNNAEEIKIITGMIVKKIIKHPNEAERGGS